MQIITVANLKGGTGKTTTAVYIAHALARRGLEVVLVDADPQGSALRWSEQAGWALPTLALPVKDLHRRIRGVIRNDVDYVVVDTPPLDEQAGIVNSALRIADHVVITMAPTLIEYERLSDVWSAIDDTSSLRDTPANAAVLFNRTVTNANSTPVYRELIENDGHIVLSATIPRRESIAQAFGAPVTDLSKYADATRELIGV